MTFQALKTWISCVLIIAALTLAAVTTAGAQTPEPPKAGDEDFVWSQGSYIRHFREDMGRSEQKPRGIPGGSNVYIDFPGNWANMHMTKLHVYHTDTRVYGIQFEHEYITDDGKVINESDILGGDAGKKTTFNFDRENNRLFSVKAHYAKINREDVEDGEFVYQTPVMTGMTVSAYKTNVLTTSSEPGVPHEDLLEVTLLGSKRMPNMVSPPEGIGFDVHLAQGIRRVSACWSPTDRNGRLFALGISTFGVMGDREKGSLECDDGGGVWRTQPLGPPRLETFDNFGDKIEGKFDPQSYASGIFSKKDEQYETVSTPGYKVDYKWKAPDMMVTEFGDQAVLRAAGVAGVTITMPLVTDPRKMRKGKPGGRDYAFEYANRTAHVGVWFEEVGGEKFAYMDFEITEGSKRYNGLYEEARMGDGKVSKRNRERKALAEAEQSKAGLFEQASVVQNRNNIYSGWDGPTLNPMVVNSGRKKRIFQESGPYQYFLDNDKNLAISDGLIFKNIWTGKGDNSSTTLVSERELSESISRSIGAALPIKGVPVGVSRTESTENSQGSSGRSMKSVATSKYYGYALALDKPNATIGRQFGTDLKNVILADEVSGPVYAEAMVKAYGTDYVGGIVFGGMARAVESLDSKSYSQSAIESYKTSGKIGNPAAFGVDGGQEERNSRTSKDMSEFSAGSFDTVGGSGGMKADNWTVNDNYVPVLFDLRPIYTLVEPLMLSKIESRWKVKFTDAQVLKARDLLKEASEARYASFLPLPDNTSLKPLIYQLSVTGLTCVNGGDDKTGEIDISGKIAVRYNDADSNTKKELLVVDSTSAKLKCDGKPTTKYNKTAYLWMSRNSPAKIAAGMSVDITETDFSAFDYDEDLKGFVAFDAPPTDFKPASGVFAMGPGWDDVAGNNTNAPTIAIEYEWQRLE